MAQHNEATNKDGVSVGDIKDGVSVGDIRAAIDAVTGAPSCGIVADVTPALVKAIDELINGKPVVEQRVIKATETRKADTATA